MIWTELSNAVPVGFNPSENTLAPPSSPSGGEGSSTYRKTWHTIVSEDESYVCKFIPKQTIL